MGYSKSIVHSLTARRFTRQCFRLGAGKVMARNQVNQTDSDSSSELLLPPKSRLKPESDPIMLQDSIPLQKPQIKLDQANKTSIQLLETPTPLETAPNWKKSHSNLMLPSSIGLRVISFSPSIIKEQ